MTIKKGLRFESRNFAAKCEVHEVRKDEVVLIMMPSDRHDFYATWPLERLKQGIKDKTYTEIKPEINFGI